jgi:hypothetical protein
MCAGVHQFLMGSITRAVLPPLVRCIDRMKQSVRLQQWVWLADIRRSYSVPGCVVIAFSRVHNVIVVCSILQQP